MIIIYAVVSGCEEITPTDLIGWSRNRKLCIDFVSQQIQSMCCEDALGYRIIDIPIDIEVLPQESWIGCVIDNCDTIVNIMKDEYDISDVNCVNFLNMELRLMFTSDKTDYEIMTFQMYGVLMDYVDETIESYMDEYVKTVLQLVCIIKHCIIQTLQEDLIRNMMFSINAAIQYKSLMDQLALLNSCNSVSGEKDKLSKELKKQSIELELKKFHKKYIDVIAIDIASNRRYQ